MIRSLSQIHPKDQVMSMHGTYVDKMVSNAKGPSDSVDRRFLNFFMAMKEVNTNHLKDDSDSLEEDQFCQPTIAKPNVDKRITNKRTNGLKKRIDQKLPVNEISEIEAEIEMICSPNGIDLKTTSKPQKLQSKNMTKIPNKIMHG